MTQVDRRWACLIVTMVLVLTACKPATEENDNGELPDATAIIDDSGIAQQATRSDKATIQPPRQPTPLPTAEEGAWQQVGNETTGLQLAIPPTWVNQSSLLSTTSAANPLGLAVVLAADSERTVSSLLAGKGVGNGAYAAGLITNLALEATTPSDALGTILQQLLPQETAVAGITPITSAAANRTQALAGAFVDVVGPAVIFPDSAKTETRTRLVLFPLQLVEGQTTPAQVVYVFSADASRWEQYNNVFLQMMESLVVYNLYQDIVINDGRANVQGRLNETDNVNGRLESGVRDIWTFTAESGDYATITVTPDNKDIDLLLSLISPTGQTIRQIDNGFAGDSELVIDLLLNEAGTYVVEISEFFNEPGPYRLSLVLSPEPLFNSGGSITFGQTIQSDLDANGQKVWMFNGVAGQTVSIVLVPNNTYDAVLALYGPDGRQLLNLDEGFSGDAEVVSGYSLPVTGEYTILVRSFTGNSGSYSLSLDEGGEDTGNFYDAGDLAYGDTRQETLQANEAHAWFFNGRAGDSVQIAVTPLTDSLDVDVWLLDPNIERLTAQDIFLAGEPERIEQVLPLDGQYLILVSDFFGEAGDYEVTLLAQASSTPQIGGEVAYGETAVGDLPPGAMVVWYFDGRTGDVINVALESTDANRDMLFYIIGPDGNRVREVDDQTAGGRELLSMFTLTADGQWGVVVGEFFGDAAPYVVTVERR